MNYQNKVNATIRARGINSFSLHKYPSLFARAAKILKNTHKDKKKTSFCAEKI